MLLNLKTTESPAEVTCKNCVDRLERLARFEVYAGHEIPLIQIDYWKDLHRSRRFGLCRRFEATKGKHSWQWWQFSDEQRAMLLSEIRKDNYAAWILGVEGVEFSDYEINQQKALFRTQAAIVKRVLAGKAPKEALEKVLEIQTKIGRGLI